MNQPAWTFPKLGLTLKVTIAVMGGLWVLLAVGTNWTDSSAARSAFGLLVGSNEVFSGEIWRLATSLVVHHPSEPFHWIFNALGLYFLGATLEERWGARRMAFFLVGSGVFAYLCQALVGAMVPRVASAQWFGALGMVEAVAVAWALSARGQTVRLFMVMPVSSTALVGFIVLISVLNVLALRSPPEGLITPFGGMLSGYLFGDASPLRRYFLKAKLRRLNEQAQAASRARPAGMRVIEGGKKSDPPPDKRWLN